MSFKSALAKHYIGKTVIPKGWATIAMVAEELGVSECRARKVATDLVKAGKAVRQKYKAYNAEGGCSIAYLYKTTGK